MRNHSRLRDRLSVGLERAICESLHRVRGGGEAQRVRERDDDLAPLFVVEHGQTYHETSA